MYCPCFPSDADTQDRATLAAYISFARKHIHPVLSEQASADLIQEYVEMRKMGTGRGTVTATPRQLESLIRLSEAIARMRYGILFHLPSKPPSAIL